MNARLMLLAAFGSSRQPLAPFIAAGPLLALI